MNSQLILDEKFTNIQKAQAGLTRLFKKAQNDKSFYRVMKNDKPLGVLIPNALWEDFIEDMEAMSSPRYIARIAKARKEKGGKTLEQVEKELGL
jgi:PHD/YefM family antitoxin component YafN of YafNO toxin-antitoxin module